MGRGQVFHTEAEWEEHADDLARQVQMVVMARLTRDGASGSYNGSPIGETLSGGVAYWDQWMADIRGSRTKASELLGEFPFVAATAAVYERDILQCYKTLL